MLDKLIDLVFVIFPENKMCFVKHELYSYGSFVMFIFFDVNYSLRCDICFFVFCFFFMPREHNLILLCVSNEVVFYSDSKLHNFPTV